MTTKCKNAAYWEGWQAYGQKRICQYTDIKDRNDWARGFAAAIHEDRDSKVWYKSRTIVVGIALLVIGAGIAIYGMLGDGGQVYAGFGSGVGSSSLLMTALRLITNTNVTFTTGGSVNGVNGAVIPQ